MNKRGKNGTSDPDPYMFLDSTNWYQVSAVNFTTDIETNIFICVLLGSNIMSIMLIIISTVLDYGIFKKKYMLSTLQHSNLLLCFHNLYILLCPQ